jgi:hypothetical protein
LVGDDLSMKEVVVSRLKALKVPATMRERASEVVAVADEICAAHLDREYGELCGVLVARLARKRPSPLQRGGVRIWAAGVIYAIGQINFLFDRTQNPHLTADELAACAGVAKSTMANKAALICRALDLDAYEPELTRVAMIEQHPMAWIIEVDGFLVDARTLPPAFQDEARRLGLIPDLQPRQAA